MKNVHTAQFQDLKVDDGHKKTKKKTFVALSRVMGSIRPQSTFT